MFIAVEGAKIDGIAGQLSAAHEAPEAGKPRMGEGATPCAFEGGAIC